MTEPTVLPVPAPRAPKLHESRCKQGEVARNVWRATPEQGTPYEAVLDRNYWINQARFLRIGDMIEVVPEGQAYWALLHVGYVDTPEMPRAADVSEIHYRLLTFASKPVSADYDIDWRGPNGKFTLINKATKAVLQGKFETKELAAAWLEDHLKKAA